MEISVIKRDGRMVPFDKDKIIHAVLGAFVSVDEEEDCGRRIAKAIANHVEQNAYDGITVEEIQDMVEQRLMASSRKDVAKAYIIYRNERSKHRNRNSALRKKVLEKLAASDVQNSNANMDERTFGGRMGAACSEVTKDVALNDVMSEMARDNHLNNMIYTHDLDSYVIGDHNCLSIPFDDLLANGFSVKQTDVRPAQSINTAFQLIAVIMQIQSLQQFGGVSATHIDHTMVPYVRKSFYKHYITGLKYIPREIHEAEPKDLSPDLSIEDDKYKVSKNVYRYAMDMTEREAKQAIEGLFHNLNTLQSRSGNQLPFSSINCGTCILPEGRMITKWIYKTLIEGLGKLHRTSIFPCVIHQYWKGVNDKPGTPNYDLYRLALEATAKRLYPNYANVDWSGNAGYDPNDPKTYFSTMGCRTANGWDINGFGQLKDGRGNICPVTIILPTLAMMAKQKVWDQLPTSSKKIVSVTKYEWTKGDMAVSYFMDILDQKIHEAKDQLIERFEWICSQPPEAAQFMYENHTMAGYVPEEGIRSALKHGTVVIGQLGLAEALQILIGCDHTEERGMELAKRIEQLFKDRCAEFKKEYKLNFGVYYTPAESLCYTAMKKFQETYGVIPNVSDHDFFTNSMHVPVWKKVSPFEKIDIESQLTGYSSAGCITCVELDGGVKNNIDALEQIVNYAMDHDIPYFAVNVPNDMCMDCGFTDEIDDVCPICGSKNIKRLRRVTGYLSTDYHNFNYGKQKEVEARVKHE